MKKGDVVMARESVGLDDELCFENQCSGCPKLKFRACNDTNIVYGDTALVIKNTKDTFGHQAFLLLHDGQIYTHYTSATEHSQFEVVT
tara:strand:+ start:1880 stop:2143 length:264 start_codon:yes stop_codon:yes gene_type:complete